MVVCVGIWGTVFWTPSGSKVILWDIAKLKLNEAIFFIYTGARVHHHVRAAGRHHIALAFSRCDRKHGL